MSSEPPDRGGAPTPRPGDPLSREGEPIGPFPTWMSLYATVVGYTALLVVVLWILSVTLDRGAP